jgi:antitoxin FitA
MGQVLVRNLDDLVIETLRRRAERHGRSLEQELRVVLTEAAAPTTAERLALVDEIRAMTPSRLSDSTPLIRDDRDER